MIDNEQDYIDLGNIALRLWKRRKFVLYLTCAFAALGLVAAVLQKPVYTASCTFVPEKSASSTSAGSLSSLAAMAGLNLGDMSSGTRLNPLIYPQLIQNVDFNKELMRAPLHFKMYPEPVSLYDLAANPEYRRFNLGAAIKKYTIGLPSLVVSAIKGGKDDSGLESSSSEIKISCFTKEEFAVYKALQRMIGMQVEKKEGYLVLSARSREPLVAAELCQAALELLQKYVAEFKLAQARESMEYIQERYDDAKADYMEKQLALARFVDANRGSLTASLKALKQQLVAEYEISTALFTEISKQRLQAEMKVKEDTPMLMPVKTVSVPMRKSNSRTRTLVLWTFLGFLLACGSVFVFDALAAHNAKLPFKWEN